MRIQQLQYYDKSWKVFLHSDGFDRLQSQLVLAFGEPALITDTSVFNHLERSYPEAHIILCSSTFMHDDVFDNSVIVTAAEFRNTFVHCVETNIEDHPGSYQAGLYLMQQLQQKDLHAAYIISDGAHINTHELIDGFNATNTRQITVTNALAGDDERFPLTSVGLNRSPGKGMVVAIGFYGRDPDCSHMEEYLRSIPTTFASVTVKS